MVHIKNFNKIFDDHVLSWKRVISLSMAITWKDWNERGKNTQLLVKALNDKTNDLKVISHNNSINISTLTKQAIAHASRDALPLARLIVHKLYSEELLDGSLDSWNAVFPKPSAFEALIQHVLEGHFYPTTEAFSELLFHAVKTDKEGNCIRNYIACSKGETISARMIFEHFLKNPSLIDVNANKLLDICLLIKKDITIIADLTYDDIYAMPASWRIDLFSRRKISSVVIDSDFLRTIDSNPHSFSETPEWLEDFNLYSEFSKTIIKGSIKIELLEKLIDNPFISDRLNKEFSWTFLNELKKPIQFNSFEINHFERIINYFIAVDCGRFANNLTSILSASFSDLSALNERVQSSLAYFISNADPEVSLSSIRLSSGKNQYFIIKNILGENPKESNRDLCVNGLYKSINEAEICGESISILISSMKKMPKKWAYRLADKYEHIGAILLQANDDYQIHFLSKIQSKKISKQIFSSSYFKAYNSLGPKGVQIIETLLENSVKISGSVSVSYILSQVAKYCVSIAEDIYSKRGISSVNFIKVVNSDEFKNLSSQKQLNLLKLKNGNGRSILQQVLKTGSLNKDLISWISSQEHLSQTLEIYLPQSEPVNKAKLSDLLAYSCLRPSKAASNLSSYNRDQLIKALPEALFILRYKPRIAAALELSVFSDLSALPVMMRLAYKLAPPYNTEKYGRRFDDLYITYELPKKSGGKRIISSPAPHLKSVQRSLLKMLYLEGFSDQSTGFIPGRSIVTNAVLHVGKEIVVNADIKSFFPSTSYKQVYSLSRRICNGSLSPLAARLFSEICCFQGSLATGAPTSPAVSNLIMAGFDISLNSIAKKLNVTYSRYADDLTFSGDPAAVWMLKPLRSYLTRLGYELDPKKTNIFRKGRRQTVTGIVVNSKINIARPLRKRLRAAVYRRINGNQPFLHDKKLSDAALNGYINYLKMISPEKAGFLLTQLRGCPEWKY